MLGVVRLSLFGNWIVIGVGNSPRCCVCFFEGFADA